MAIGNRLPAPKNGKIKNTPLVQQYKRDHPFCEVCRLEGHYITAGLELHHIIPGNGRTDELWNIARLCVKHHIMCTEHIHGAKARVRNGVLLALKYVKGELTAEKLSLLFNVNEVMLLIPSMEEVYKSSANFRSMMTEWSE